MFGAFAIGTAAPNLEKIATARGAAYMIWDLIDRVSDLVIHFYGIFLCYTLLSNPSNSRQNLIFDRLCL